MGFHYIQSFGPSAPSQIASTIYQEANNSSMIPMEYVTRLGLLKGIQMENVFPLFFLGFFVQLKEDNRIHITHEVCGTTGGSTEAEEESRGLVCVCNGHGGSLLIHRRGYRAVYCLLCWYTLYVHVCSNLKGKMRTICAPMMQKCWHSRAASCFVPGFRIRDD